jgi:hypothetical protein
MAVKLFHGTQRQLLGEKQKSGYPWQDHQVERSNLQGTVITKGNGAKKIFWNFGCNPLKSPKSDEGIQGKPRKTRDFCLGFPSFFLGFLWSVLDWLGLTWIGFGDRAAMFPR